MIIFLPSVSGYEVLISKDENMACSNGANNVKRHKDSNKNECKDKCNEDPDCNMFSITEDNICKTIETCKIENIKQPTKRQTTYKKLQGN